MKILEKYDINFKNSSLLNEALTHSSYSYEHNNSTNYERLEFLGDSILALVVSDYLFKTEKVREGELSKKRSSFICETALDYYARKINLLPYIKLSNGQPLNETIIADVFEAILAVIYLEKGFFVVKEFIHEVIIPEIDADKHFFNDYKTLIQEYVQTNKKSLSYVIVNEYGEPHDKTFEVELIIDNIKYGKGIGKSKKEAEQQAAKDAYNKSVK